MTTTLRLIVDQLVAPVPGALGRYTGDLARALVASAPRGTEVEGIVSSSPEADYERILAEVPGLSGLYKSSLARRELTAAWQYGVTTSPGGGIIHAPNLFAPLRKHTREGGNQVVVTVHDVLAWTHPEAMSATSVGWHKAMLKRARKHADAVVVPTHALADQLSMVVDLGDRIRVVGTAPRSGLVVGADAAERAARLALPSTYVVAAGTLEPRTGLVDLLTALGRPEAAGASIVVLGPESWGEQHLATVAEEVGVESGRVRQFDDLSPADLAVVLDRAAAFVAPSRHAGSGTALIEAFSLETPVIHTDIPVFAETAAGAGLSVPLGTGDELADGLADAVGRLLGDAQLASRLAVTGADRGRAFTWRDAAERVWQLHADL